MKKIINYITDFHHQDPQGLYGGIAIYSFIYVLLFHILPIIKP
jgi:hypothetical protein